MDVLVVEIIKNLSGWGYTFESLVGQTRKFSGKTIVVPVNTFGGDLFEGLSIYNYLKGHDAQIEVRIVAYAMSMGTVIACAANKVIMPENGWYMIHNPYLRGGGDHNGMKKMGEVLEKMTNDLAGIYSKKTGIPVVEIIEMMNKETWLTAKEAKAKGFVDELTEGMSIAACLDKEVLNEFTNIPEPVLKAHGIHKPENSQPMKDIFKVLATFFGKPVDENTKPEELQAMIDAKAQVEGQRDSQFQTLQSEFKAFKDGLNESITTAVNAAFEKGSTSIKTEIEASTKTAVEAAVTAAKTEVEGKIKNVADEFNNFKGSKQTPPKTGDNSTEGLGMEYQPEGVEVIEASGIDSIF